jgi:hypothetical protein
MSADHPRYSSGRRSGAKPLSALLGVAALTTLGALSFGVAAPDATVVDIPMAGSGSAPMNTTFTQPVVGAMSMGNTATSTTPASAPTVSVATPAVKAGH